MDADRTKARHARRWRVLLLLICLLLGAANWFDTSLKRLLARGVLPLDGAKALAAGPPASGTQEGDGEQAREWLKRDLCGARRRGLQLGVPHGAYARAVAQTAQMEAASMVARSRGAAGVASPFIWDFLGPMPIFGNVPSFAGQKLGPPLANSTGRVSALAVDPRTRGRVFVGAPGGASCFTNTTRFPFTPIFEPQ